MFGLGREARVRRDAVTMICEAMRAEVRKEAGLRQHLGLVPEPSASLTDPLSLANELIGRVPKSSFGSFAGQRLPSLSGMGLAIEALFYGLNAMDAGFHRQRLVCDALGLVLTVAAKRQAELNGADYEMLQTVGGAYVRHPLVIEATRPASARPAAA